MSTNEIATLKAEIQQEERLYLIELKTDQRFEKLKAIRLKINMLKKLLEMEQGEPST